MADAATTAGPRARTENLNQTSDAAVAQAKPGRGDGGAGDAVMPRASPGPGRLASQVMPCRRRVPVDPAKTRTVTCHDQRPGPVSATATTQLEVAGL